MTLLELNEVRRDAEVLIRTRERQLVKECAKARMTKAAAARLHGVTRQHIDYIAKREGIFFPVRWEQQGETK